MSVSGLRERVRALALGLLVVPVFFFAEHAVPGFPLAQGCGAEGNDGGGRLVVRDSGETSVDVATDGFFALVPSPELTVTVTTLDGDVVEGEIDDFGWHASAPLPLGTTLKAVVATVVQRDTPVVTDEVELRVVAEPPAVTGEGLTFGDWHRYAQPVGELVECTPPDDPAAKCGESSVRAPAAVELVDVVELHWSPPPGGSTYAVWELDIDLDDIDNADFQGSAGFRLLRLAEHDLGWLKFPPGAERYCVTLTVRDARTGETASAESCTEPQPTTTVLRDYDLALCEKPPSEAMTEEWCQAHPESSLAACTGGAGEADPDPEGAHGRRNSEGCQLSWGAAGSTGSLTFLALFGVMTLGRRLHARRTAAR